MSKYAWERTKKPAGDQRGCENCPLNKSSIRKVIRVDEIKGRSAMLWAMAPGELESRAGKELVGPAGKFLWKYAEEYGLRRSDFDIQNVVRCRPTKTIDTQYGQRVIDREPTKIESRCCSLHTDDALARQNQAAKVHLILGQFAAKTLLGKEYRKDHPVFWSAHLNAKVICVAHPAYFLRGGNRTKLDEFRAGLRAVKDVVSGDAGTSQFAYLESQNYRGYTRAARALPKIQELAELAKRAPIAVDLEEGFVDGKRVVLCIGICTKPGHSHIFYIDHPEKPAPTEERDAIVAALKPILESPEVSKVFHHGTSDDKMLRNLGIRLKGYKFDTNYSEYLAYSSRRKFGLAEIAYARFPEFAGYKDIIKPYIDPTAVNYANIPKSVMTPYTGADCDISKRIELSTTKRIDLRLLQVYTEAAYVIDAMEGRGPKLDTNYYDRLIGILPKYVRSIVNQLQVLANDPTFNPNKPASVAHILYDVLKFPAVATDKRGNPTRGTGKEILQLLLDVRDHPFLRLMVEYRRYNKIDSTYLPNYRRSAELHGGELRTQWWLTGTITGRLRAGGGKDGKAKGIVNFQNLHGSPMLQNLLVSDLDWKGTGRVWITERTKDPSGKDIWAYKTARSEAEILEMFGDLWVFLALDYSQAELRVLAHMSQDKLLISQFRSGIDIHALVVHELVGWPVAEILNNEEQRRLGKNIHFGVVFGLTEDSLVDYARAKGAKIAEAVIRKAYRKYFDKYVGVNNFIKRQRTIGEKTGVVSTMFGFNREINTGGDDGRATFWGNQSVNSPIQGGSHQMLLIAMAILKRNPNKYKPLRRMLAEIHDAFYYYVRLRDLPVAYKRAKYLMEQAVPIYMEKHFGIKFSVPLVADAKAGFRMGTMAKYKGGPVKEFLSSWLSKNAEIDEKVESELSRVQST
jgi:uracil-DNA glycosylase family 4